jgi:peptidyl-tRNA hydrolase, PTH1 family
MIKNENSIYLIVGLGNPGREYQATRHNVGFLAVKFLAEKLKWGDFKEQKKFQAEILETKFQAKKIIMAKPQTFMNNSGEAVAALKNFYKIPSQNIIIIYDELDLPMGKIRVRPDGSSAGHNGIKSIIEHLGTDKFWRVRIGIGNELKGKMEAANFVLSKFSKEEKSLLIKNILPEVVGEVEKII